MKPVNKLLAGYLLILPLIAGAISFTYFQLETTINRIETTISQNETTHARQFSENLASTLIAKSGGNVVGALTEDPALHAWIETMLSNFIAEHYAYVYVVYRDDEGKFRYLADGSKALAEKGELGQKFDTGSPLWNQVYDSKKAHVYVEKEIDNLWITHLYPIVTGNETRGLIVFDFSNNIAQEIEAILHPVNSMLFYLIVLIVLLFLLMAVQLYNYHKSRRNSLYDPLTSAFNRRYLSEFSNHVELSRYCLFMIDIDHFKKINDTYGHDAGDVILQSVAKRIMHQIKKDDVLIRYGGEEFLLILRDISKKDALQIAQRIRQAVAAEPYAVGSAALHVSVSIGANTDLSQDRDFEAAVKTADVCLYRAKEQGRNRIVDERML